MISIIIPVYNIEDYLTNCIESIISQSYNDFELILINDGSTDRGGEICEEYTKKDNRIRVFHQANCGVSASRNLGIRVSKGDYIIFVDGDDLLCEGSLFDLRQRIEEKEYDVIIMNSYVIKKKKLKEYKPFSKKQSQKTLTGIDVFKFYDRGAIWGIAFRREFILQNDIWFTTRMKNSEDSLFFSMCLMYAQSIIHYPIDFYKVNERQGSASRTWDFDKIIDMTKGFEVIKEMLQSRELNYNQKAVLFTEAYLIASYSIVKFISLGKIKGYNDLKKKIKNSSLFPIGLKGIHLKKTKIMIFNLSYDLYFLCCFLIVTTIERRYYNV